MPAAARPMTAEKRALQSPRVDTAISPIVVTKAAIKPKNSGACMEVSMYESVK